MYKIHIGVSFIEVDNEIAVFDIKMRSFVAEVVEKLRKGFFLILMDII